MDDDHDATQAVAAYFHHARKAAKDARKGEPRSTPMHPRANTDWWNVIPGGKKYRP